MKKTSRIKLRLGSETIRMLNDAQLANAAGGIVKPRSVGCFGTDICPTEGPESSACPSGMGPCPSHLDPCLPTGQYCP